MLNRLFRVLFGLLFLGMGSVGLLASAYRPYALAYLPFVPIGLGVSLVRRLVWCFAWTTIGFAASAFNSSRSWEGKKSPFLAYLFFYPPFLIVNSLLVFGVFNVSPLQGKLFFYPISAWLCLNLAFWIDVVNFKRMADAIINKVGGGAISK